MLQGDITNIKNSSAPGGAPAKNPGHAPACSDKNMKISILPIQKVNNRARLLFLQIMSGLDHDNIKDGCHQAKMEGLYSYTKHKLRKRFCNKWIEDADSI